MKLVDDIDRVYNYLACTHSGNQEAADSFDRVIEYLQGCEKRLTECGERARDKKAPES